MAKVEKKQNPKQDKEKKKLKRKSLAAFFSGLILLITSIVLILLLWPKSEEASPSSSSLDPYAYLGEASSALEEMEGALIGEGEIAYPDSYHLDAKVQQGGSKTSTQCAYTKDPFSFTYSEGLDDLFTQTVYSKEGDLYYASQNGGSLEEVSYAIIQGNLDLAYGVYEEAVANFPEQLAILKLLKEHPTAVEQGSFLNQGEGSFDLSLSGEDLDLRSNEQTLSKLEISYRNHRCSYFHKAYSGDAGDGEIEYSFSSDPFLKS